MKFAQQNPGSVELFGKYYWDVDMKDSPHYKFLQGDQQTYLDYIEKSWQYLRPSRNTPELRQLRVSRFKNLTGMDLEPIKIVKYRGESFVIDGNHRAAIALHENKRLDITEVDLKSYLEELVKVPSHFYGSKHKNMPYQALFHDGKLLIDGRRTDTLKRFQMLRSSDFDGKVVVDIGCNIGANAILCAEAGATVKGYDIISGVINAAIRINVLLGLPCYYEVRDFSQPQDVGGDVAIAFSIDQHIANNDVLSRNLSKFDIVYFETHEGADIPKEISELFNEEYLGNLGKRKLYRLTK